MQASEAAIAVIGVTEREGRKALLREVCQGAEKEICTVFCIHIEVDCFAGKTLLQVLILPVPAVAVVSLQRDALLLAEVEAGGTGRFRRKCMVSCGRREWCRSI